MDLNTLLTNSSASDEFKAEVLSLASSYGSERIVTVRPAPPIKVQRVLAQLLHAEPELAIERVTLDARSGCSDFIGVLTVEAADVVRSFSFIWDCKWRAEQEGWTDWFGLPDQIRAAQEFGWRCFAAWQERTAPTPVASS